MSHSSRAAADRNLLFGILALQMDFISRDALIAAMHAWVLEKTKPLGQLLVEQGAMAEDARALLEPLVQKHVQTHSGDAAKSLASVGSVGSARQGLEQIGDADVQASLAHIPAEASAAEVAWPTLPPTLVGTPTSSGLRFHVLRPHAQGGLGEVFVAQDTELHREVALKEIQDRYADDLNKRSRFVLEAEITGGLEHPGIVPVYGLGTYADGRPYYAMRFIRGDSLQKAIAQFHHADLLGRDPSERALSLRELLGRFIGVCNAIDYAHSRGVLHRDLKPGNVMLGKYGETLVVDWGLAKPLAGPEGATEATEGPLRPSSANGSTPTEMGSVLGTPEYMSPEQAAGRPDQLGPSSDVYSLGATLYCLLTGAAPFQRKDDPWEVVRQVQRGEFRSPRQVKREVPAALEAVCLKAMALKPQDRYASPRALAADVERWLADEPVSAWREPLRLRLGRWARRHQTLMVAAATGVLVLVLAMGTGAWWLDRQRTEQRRSVESALTEVERLQEQGRWSEARAVLGQARERLGQSGPRDLQQRLDQGARNLDLAAQLDAIRLKKATIIEGQFNIKGADREYEEAFRELGGIEVNSSVEAAAARVRASAIRDALLAALDDWAICANERQRLTWLVSVARAAYTDPSQKRARDPVIWEDKAALVRLLTEGDLSEQSPQLLHALGLRLWKLGGDAEPLFRTAQQRYPGDFWINFDLGNVLCGNVKTLTDAVGYYRAALAVRPGTPAVYTNLGHTLRDMGRLKEAVAEFRKAIELDPKDALPHIGLGLALRFMGRFEGAIAEYHRAVELDPKKATAHYNLGNALYTMGRFGEAVTEYRKASELNPTIDVAHYLARSERLLALDKELAAFLQGSKRAANAAELLSLVELCRIKKRFAAAVRFYTDFFTAQPKLADDLYAAYRYNHAACLAALAGAGRGEDGAKLDAHERARLRQQARDWLRAELALRSKQIEQGTPEDRATAQWALQQWQQDTDLAGLRDIDAVDKLPEAERADCRKLWEDVAALLKKTEAKKE